MQTFHPCACFVVPPVILHEMAKNANCDDDRRNAMNSLGASMRLRGRRDIMAHITLGGLAPAKASADINRSVFNANGTEQLPGQLMRTEGQPDSVDAMVNEAYDGAGLVYDFLKQVFNRNSIDDRGLHLDATVNYGRLYDNAFWEGRQMVYGNGDGRFFNRFTVDPVVIVHESFHGVTQHECNLDYYEQPGAANESFSDVFGVVAHQWDVMCRKQAGWSFKNASWLVGAGLFTGIVKGKALRDLAAPGTAYNDPIIGRDLQPAHMKDFVHTEEDEHGVHINSGILNHAFFILCDQLQNIPSWQAPAQFWYHALLRLRRYSDFMAVAATTNRVARELCGSNSREQVAVERAWEAVGLPLPAGA